MLRSVFAGAVSEDGRELRLDEPGRWRGLLARHKGRRMRLTIAQEQAPRTLRQNAYLWGAVYPALAEWSGHTPEEIHEAMKRKFLATRIVLPTGEEIETGSTTMLDTRGFGDFVESVRAFAAMNCGISIPDPGQVEVSL